MLVPTWLRYRKVDLEHKLKSTFDLAGNATEFLDEIFGPHYMSASGGENILLPYLPDYYREIDEFVALTEAESAELLLASEEIDRNMDDQYILTSSPEAVRRREKMLGIQADPSTESLEFRKQRLLNRYQTKPPFTIRWLQQQLDKLVGPGMTIVSIDVQNFILYVTTNVQNANIFKELHHTIETIKPANLVYQQNTALADTIGLEEHISTKEITWNYSLGTWKLGEKPFSTLAPEVVIK